MSEVDHVGRFHLGIVAACVLASLCVYLVDNNQSVTYVKSSTGEWTRGWEDEGSAGVGRLAKRAAANQRLHEQAAS